MSKGRETLRDAIAEGIDKERKAAAKRQQEQLVGLFHYDAGIENLLDLEKRDPAAFDRLSPRIKMRIGHYAAQKAAAKAEGIDVTGGSHE